MPKQSRRSFTTEQKVTILRRHLMDKVPVSALCEEYKLQPASGPTSARPPVRGRADDDRRQERSDRMGRGRPDHQRRGPSESTPPTPDRTSTARPEHGHPQQVVFLVSTTKKTSCTKLSK